MRDRPVVVSMEGNTVLMDGFPIGHLDPAEWHPFLVFGSPTGVSSVSYGAKALRAIADFLEQLEGANLLSGIREAGE